MIKNIFNLIFHLIIIILCIFIGISGLIKTFVFEWPIINGVLSLLFLSFGLFPFFNLFKNTRDYK